MIASKKYVDDAIKSERSSRWCMENSSRDDVRNLKRALEALCMHLGVRLEVVSPGIKVVEVWPKKEDL